MEIIPTSLKRGDQLENLDGNFLGCIGGFRCACVGGKNLDEPLEVLLVEGSREEGLRARVGDAKHRVYEGKLSKSEVSFTLEAFRTSQKGDPLKNLRKDSACFEIPVHGNLRDSIIHYCEQNKIRGGLLHVEGIANRLKIFGHTDPVKLNNETKTFDEIHDPVVIEGWGNFSYINGATPFVHVHGILQKEGTKKGGHFIMDDVTHMLLQNAKLLVFPSAPIVRSKQKEDFPTWKLAP